MKAKVSSVRVAIGLHSVREALKVRPKSVKKLILKAETNHDLAALEDLAKRLRIPIELRKASILDQLGHGHQGVACEISESPEADWEKIFSAKSAMILVLDGIEDPHNLGAILRTAWLMGVDAVLTPKERAVGVTPTVHKVACGGVEHVPIELVTNFSGKFNEFKENGFWIYGLDGTAKRSLYEFEIAEKAVLVIGSEEKGMRTTTRTLCDEICFLPQIVADASYNASVACAISVAEVRRQIQKKTLLLK